MVTVCFAGGRVTRPRSAPCQSQVRRPPPARPGLPRADTKAAARPLQGLLVGDEEGPHRARDRSHNITSSLSILYTRQGMAIKTRHKPSSADDRRPATRGVSNPPERPSPATRRRSPGRGDRALATDSCRSEKKKKNTAADQGDATEAEPEEELPSSLRRETDDGSGGGTGGWGGGGAGLGGVLALRVIILRSLVSLVILEA